MLALGHEIHVMMRRIRKGQLNYNSIVPTTIKIFSDPLGIIAEYEKSGFPIGNLYKLQGPAIVVLLEIAVEGLSLGIVDIVAPADMHGYGFRRCRDLLG